MKFFSAIDVYIADQRVTGRINSDRTERSYRDALVKLGEDVSNRDPRFVGREDVKLSLSRWPNANTFGPASVVLRELS
jgi:hypothetical protein